MKFSAFAIQLERPLRVSVPVGHLYRLWELKSYKFAGENFTYYR